MNANQIVQFNNQEIPVFFHNDKPYVAMKPICENIGLDWNGQFQRIKRNHILSQGMCMIHTPTKGGNQEMVTLPIGYLNGWLFGIDVNKVKPEIKQTLIKYQLECFDVLYNHFMPKVATAHPNTITAEQKQQIKEAVGSRHHRTGEHWQTIYHKLHEYIGVNDYHSIPQSKFDDALFWLNDGCVKPKVDILENLKREIYQICFNALSSNKEQIQLLHNMNLSFRSDSIDSSIQFLRKENREILEFSRRYDLTSRTALPLVSKTGYVSMQNGGGFEMARYF